ncbi:unnamed protein product [Microthlaspi erraticum]|uniref:HTH myb-type domain-containing protein n=1 Tax=Microthlaspi erraticum TaxID=1685480 RepID=A0A6D2I6R7_9BRAS|nr:unnamed protein product [Microthlaspi erraticum]
MILGEKISGGSSWSRDDDIAFERALAIYTDETENRWGKIAEVVPGKTLEQIMKHYEDLVHDVTRIESGHVPLPDYGQGSKKLKQKRRRGIAWTANEHRLFLIGLDKYGKGDWRSISRHFVVSRTSTQVASHAQKYFARLASKKKNKKRRSILDDNLIANESINTSIGQGQITWQNIQATNQPNPQPSLDFAPYGATPNIWNTQTISQPSLDHRLMYGNGAPTLWNTRATPQTSSLYDMPTIGQSMVGPMVLPFGTDMNSLAPPSMAYGVQNQPVAYFPVGPSAPMNMSSIPYNMTYLPYSR